jgi:maltokinase
MGELLAAWLPTRRWFAGSGATVRDVAIHSDVVLATGDPELRHLLVDATVGTQTVRYQVLLGLAPDLPGELAEAAIGTVPDRPRSLDGPDRPDRRDGHDDPAGPDALVAYDGAMDPRLTMVLLEGIASARHAGPVSFVPEAGTVIDTNVIPRTLPALQSNTAVVFGDRAIMKLLRRPFEGHHPDLEIPAKLARAGSRLVAEPLGWIEADDTILAILSRYFPHATDAWKLAIADLRTEAPDFSEQARTLGQATARLHRELADAFGASTLPEAGRADLAANMLAELDAATEVVGELAGYRDAIAARYAELAELTHPIPIQRIHGDYHLEQVLGTNDGWVILDFEGEPSVPLARRRAFAPPLRDVAGMLRSFDYAARHQELEQPDNQRLPAIAADWVSACQDSFRAGYGEAGGEEPRRSDPLLRALTVQKAVYEAVYEARHRPSWLRIPLNAIAEAVDEGDR